MTGEDAALRCIWLCRLNTIFPGALHAPNMARHSRIQCVLHELSMKRAEAYHGSCLLCSAHIQLGCSTIRELTFFARPSNEHDVQKVANAGKALLQSQAASPGTSDSSMLK